jgi:hypothetical protein
MRPRFRISSLLWITALVAAFFCGRQSIEIQSVAQRWWQVNRVRWGASVSKVEIVHWPPGSVTINEINNIRSATTNDPSIASPTFPAANQMCVSPKADGQTVVSYNLAGGTQRNAELKVEVLNGKVTMDWMLTHQ